MGEFVGCAGTFAADMDSAQAPGRDHLAPYSSIVDGSPRAQSITAESCSFRSRWRALNGSTQTVGAGRMRMRGGDPFGRPRGEGGPCYITFRKGIYGTPAMYFCQKLT